ncbi:hypothetical protein SAMN05192563_103021 [Paraburkholderia aspalathi]|uniref:Uncharacterized protein n=1 Tax=Paraburkholderia aspalathi TaxID=1324617 RepID=A0A1I7ELQ2_9BURK|nr:hypothetical protein SAMN05192563_103021 [Paraburkholderia aspalathi]
MAALGSGGIGVKEISNDPSQQFVDAIDSMLGDRSDDVAQVSPGIKAIKFGGAGQCADSGAAFAAAI